MAGLITFRISDEDRQWQEKIIRYRYKQGMLKKPQWTEYIKYLFNRDATEVINEINQRRK